jgi:hypothetical protein
MAYFIFLKYLRSLEEFRKNPHVKIPPKSPCTNFQSPGIFKKKFYSKFFFPHFQPNRASSQLAHPDFRPSSPHGPTSHLLPPPAPEPNAQGTAAGRPRAAPWSTPTPSTGRKKMTASIPLHSPINRRHSPLFKHR